jgi:peptidoglycan/LPS O-acetylase OafA/YrhL
MRPCLFAREQALLARGIPGRDPGRCKAPVGMTSAEFLRLGFALAMVLVALLTATLLARRAALPDASGRFLAIDGLRGYLAFAVFVHHTNLWEPAVATGRWGHSTSWVFTHFGEDGVAVFFMVTGFLFTTRLLDSRSRPLDWGRLLLSRVTRLFPMYAVAVLLMFAVVGHATGWRLQVPLPTLLDDAWRWLGFVIFGARNLNGFHETALVMSWVVWTLRYEWLFYLMLPLLGLLLGTRVPRLYLAFGLACLAGFLAWHPPWHKVVVILPLFLGGIAAAFLVRVDAIRRVGGHRWTGWLGWGLVAWVLTLHESVYGGFFRQALLALLFLLVACGNDLLGVLRLKGSRLLGEISYSLYLLHGIVLYVVFTFVVGRDTAATWPVVGFWSFAILLTPFMVLLSYATFRWVEAPWMARTARINAWLQRSLRRSRPIAIEGEVARAD